MPRVVNPGDWPVVAGGRRRLDIRRIAATPGAALPAGVHDEVGVPRRGPGQPLMGERPAAAIPDGLENGRQRTGSSRRDVEPPADRLAQKATEGDIEGLDGPKVGRERCEDRLACGRAGRIERGRPEGIEVIRFGAFGSIGSQLVDGQVEG